MTELTYDLNKKKYSRVHTGPVALAYFREGSVDVETLPPTCLVFFSYGSVQGTLMLRRDHTMLQLLNDYFPHEEDPECAKREDLQALVDHMESQGLSNGSELARFLEEVYGKLVDEDYLASLAEGLRFSAEYPLQISTPEADFKRILQGRGKAYTWRKEFWEPVGEEIDVATFAPPPEPRQTYSSPMKEA